MARAYTLVDRHRLNYGPDTKTLVRSIELGHCPNGVIQFQTRGRNFAVYVDRLERGKQEDDWIIRGSMVEAQGFDAVPDVQFRARWNTETFTGSIGIYQRKT